MQTSLYGASKLAGEGLIAAYCEGFGFQGWIFRFVSILGERYTHGHVFDFYKQAAAGSRRACRSSATARSASRYLYVGDCVDAILLAIEQAPTARSTSSTSAPTSTARSNDSIGWICDRPGRAAPTCEYTGGERGWIGDNPFIFLDTARIRALGWKPKLTIREAVERTVAYLRAEDWVLAARA